MLECEELFKVGVAAETEGKGCNFFLSSTHAASWLVKPACWLATGTIPSPVPLLCALAQTHRGSLLRKALSQVTAIRMFP